MRVTVVIPTLGGPDLHAAVGSALAQPEVQEVVVVDNDGRAAVPSAARTLRPGRNLGFAAGCNLGAEQAGGGWLLFLNDDATLPAAAMARMLEAAAAYPDTVVWAPVVTDDSGAVESAGVDFSHTGFFAHRTTAPDHPARVFAVTGACLLIRRTDFARLGGFDARSFAYSEDTDLCWRARLSGGEVRVVPDVRVPHRRSVTTRRVLSPAEVRELTFRNRLRTILSCAGGHTLALVLPLHAAGAVLLAVALLATGRPRSALAIVRALAWPLTHGAELREDRARAQALRVRPDREAVPPDLRGGGRLLDRGRAFLYRWER